MNTNESNTTVHETENSTLSPHPHGGGVNTSTGYVFDRTSTTAEAPLTVTTMDAAPTADTTIDYYNNLEMSGNIFPHSEQGNAAYMFPTMHATGSAVLAGEAGDDAMTYQYTNADADIDTDGVNYLQQNDSDVHYRSRAVQESLHHNIANTDDDANRENGNDNIPVITTATATVVVNDPDMDQLMRAANDQLKEELNHIDTAVKRLFKELVAFKTASAKVSAQWAPLLEAERQEAIRLFELQAEVERTVNMTLSHSK